MNREVKFWTILLICIVSVGSATAVSATDPDDIYWEEGAAAPGFDGPVYALVVYGGRLIAGGNFGNCGATSANKIAAWDGSSWLPLGSGMNGNVTGLTVYNGELIASGGFTDAGGTPVVNIAAWDGFSWSPLGPGLDRDIQAMAVYDGELAVGYKYTYGLGTRDLAIATWNGSSWSHITIVVEPLGYEGPLEFRDMAVFEGRLIVAGTYMMGCCPATAYSIAGWDGASWSALGSWPTENTTWLQALAVYNNNLIAGGAWGELRSWDGSTWSDIEPRIGGDDFVGALAVHLGELIVGGDFFTTPGLPENTKIGAWDGSSWSTLGSGLTGGGVGALAVYNNKLAVAGDFTTAGDKASPYMAWWTKPIVTAVSITGFEARAAVNGIALSWAINADETIEGFNIYRSGGGEFTEQLLNDQLIPATVTSYIDQTALPGERYAYTLAAVGTKSGEVRSVPAEAEMAPLTVQLYQNSPNPFNPTTTIRYAVPQVSRVTLRVYTPAGQLVRTLVDAKLPAGIKSATWDGTNDAGVSVASGVYVYRLQVGKETLSKKMTLLK